MICKKCKIDKDESEFSYKDKIRGIKHCVCNECQREYKRNYYYMNKESHFKRRKETYNKIRDYIINHKKEHPCLICGESAIECLDFHHLDNKVDEIAHLRNRGATNKILEEIKKCVVLCANCHRKVHAGSLKLEDYLK